MTELIGAIATVLAVSGVLLNNRLNIWCFALWAVSNTLSAGLYVNAGLWSLAVRDVIFLVLAGEGAMRWRRRREVHDAPPAIDVEYVFDVGEFNDGFVTFTCSSCGEDSNGLETDNTRP